MQAAGPYPTYEDVAVQVTEVRPIHADVAVQAALVQPADIDEAVQAASLYPNSALKAVNPYVTTEPVANPKPVARIVHVQDSVCHDPKYSRLVEEAKRREKELAKLEGNRGFGFQPNNSRRPF